VTVGFEIPHRKQHIKKWS